MDMARAKWRVAMVVAVVIFLSLSSSMADPRTEVAGQFCNTSLAVSGATLAANFVPAMANLSQVVEENGYGTSRVGQDPNAVLGLAQCFGDLDAVDCRLCFSEIRSQLPRCYPKTGGTLFLDGCFGRYENFTFFNQISNKDDTTVCSPNRSSEAAQFREAVRDVAGNVSSAAQRNRGFAVGSAALNSSSGLRVYALAQCWESLDSELCNSCLNTAASSIMTCVPSSEGRALKAGCYMRYSTSLFWNLNQASQSSSGRNRSLGIIIGTTIGVILVMIIMVVFILWKKNCLGKLTNRGSSADLFKAELGLGGSCSANSTIPYNQLKAATKNFDLSNKIGEGSYGTVYRGTFSDGKEVAIKRLFLNPQQWKDQFVNEVDLINRVRHKNLVKLLGCSVDGPESMLVYEYFVNKSLDHFIFDSRKAKIMNWEKRLSILQGVAEGLFYLHEESEIRIIHRDIKASNILLDDKYKPKITDFGLARAFGQDLTHLSTGVAGTVGYMAPEYIVHGQLTEKVDVYSFGILVLEVLTGKRCTSGTGNQAAQHFLAQVWSHYKASTGEKLIDRSFYEEKMKLEILQVLHVGLLCTQAMASSRPKMGKVVELLRSNKDEEVLYPSEPPFLDVIGMEDFLEDDVSHLLSISPGLRLSDSTSSHLGGR